MVPVKRILVPTDFSKGSEAAYPVAQKLAILFKAEIDLIHVVPSMKHFIRFLTADMDTEYIDKMVSHAERKINSAMENFDKEIRGEYFIKIDRKPSEAILQHVHVRDYGLIVMGATGGHETKMKRGGTTQLTIRKSAIPVLAVDTGMMRKGVRQILVPTDGSELSFSALSRAAVLAGLFNSELTLFYVSELRGGLADPTQFVPDEIQKDKVYAQLLKKIEQYLELQKNKEIVLERGGELFKDILLVQSGDEVKRITMKTEIVSGFSAHYEIETYAVENSDLVVMATHGYSGFAHMFLGSVTEKVLQYVNKPVLTVRPSEADFARSQKEEKKKYLEPFP